MTPWRRVLESFWFLPALLCVVAAVLAQLLVLLNQTWSGREGLLGPLLYEAGTDGSRDLMGAIASSMLTVAATTFSITIAVLALTSSTYGPRLVRGFMADRGNQLVLGTFVATFLYALLVLRSIRTVGESGQDAFVPHLAVNVGVLLAVADVALLVYFIHHISDSIQVWTLSRRARGELLAAARRPYPSDVGNDGPALPDPAQDDVQRDEVTEVRAEDGGYVTAVAGRRLMTAASRADVVVLLHVRPGTHVLPGALLATVPGTRVDGRLESTVRRAVRVSGQRDTRQDLEFAVQQLVELAVRALSPSTNDPYTAMNALDDLAWGLAGLARTPQPSPWRSDPSGAPRVHAHGVEVTALVDQVFDAVRTYALDHPVVLLRAVEIAGTVGDGGRDGVRAQLADHLDQLLEAFASSSPQPRDLTVLHESVEACRTRLAADTVPTGLPQRT